MAPVVSAALGALGPLLGKLAGLVAGEYGRLKGVGREIRSLQSELTSMHAALEEYTELEDPSVQVKAWISLVRELAYDTEDIFDKFIHQLRKGGHRGGFKGFLRKITLPLKKLGDRCGIADQIDDLKVRIKQVKELKDCYKLNDAPSSSTRHVAVDPRLHALFVDEAHLVGVDGPRDELAKWMVDGSSLSKHCRVLSIVGFGGLGKTTLANEVYRKIQGQFDCLAFVSVSQKPDIKKIIKDLISQVPCEDGFTDDIYDWDERKSIAKLRELLHDKR
jgi:disease resistance protein RPM1